MRTEDQSGFRVDGTLQRPDFKSRKDWLYSRASIMSKRDYCLSLFSGFLIGLLALPVLRAARSDLYLKIGYIVVPFFMIGTPAGLAVAKTISHRYSIVWQIGKFLVIGTLNTLVDWGTLMLLTFSLRNHFNIDSKYSIISGIPIYSFCKSTSFVVAVINSYYWNKNWTFSEGLAIKTNADFCQFLLATIVGFGINVGVSAYIFGYIKPGSFNVDQWGLIAAAFGTLLGLGWNFLVYKFVVFRK